MTALRLLRSLRRTRVGSFTIDQAAPPDECELLPVGSAVSSLERVEVTDDVADLVGHGRVLPAWGGDGPWAVHRPDGELIAVYERFRDGEAKPAVVLAI